MRLLFQKSYSYASKTVTIMRIIIFEMFKLDFVFLLLSHYVRGVPQHLSNQDCWGTMSSIKSTNSNLKSFLTLLVNWLLHKQEAGQILDWVGYKTFSPMLLLPTYVVAIANWFEPSKTWFHPFVTADNFGLINVVLHL